MTNVGTPARSLRRPQGKRKPFDEGWAAQDGDKEGNVSSVARFKFRKGAVNMKRFSVRPGRAADR